jgi:predicted flap endonuclease-1-like 5' DNA nuclease
VLILAVITIIALAALGGYFFGVYRRAPLPSSQPAPTTSPVTSATEAADPASNVEQERADIEKARIIRSLATESFALRGNRDNGGTASSDLAHVHGATGELEAAVANARAETARYRQLVVDIENNAPPPILLGTAEPDDLKMIVGIGPVLERMLHNLGIGTFRQIARWTEREIADFDAKLTEFPGRIVRDQWVTQARALHESKYGASPLAR